MQVQRPVRRREPEPSARRARSEKARSALGRASVLVMLAPYCMIHFHKPMLEAFGAIGAGLVLGHLAWRTGTIVYGWFLHYAVALSMDLLALHQAGHF